MKFETASRDCHPRVYAEHPFDTPFTKSIIEQPKSIEQLESRKSFSTYVPSLPRFHPADKTRAAHGGSFPPLVVLFTRFLPPEKIFSYRSIRMCTCVTLSLPFSRSTARVFSAFLSLLHLSSSRAHDLRSRSGGVTVTATQPGMPAVCVGARFRRSQHSYFHTKPYDFTGSTFEG